MQKVRQGNTLYILQCDYRQYYEYERLVFDIERVMVSNDPPRQAGECLVQNGLVPRAQINDIIKHGFHILKDHRGSFTAITQSRRKANSVAKYLNGLIT